MGSNMDKISYPILHPRCQNVERIATNGWHTIVMRYNTPDTIYVFGRNTYGML